jgi:hypothetical protein
MQKISIDTSMKKFVDEDRYNNVYVGLELEGTQPEDGEVTNYLKQLADRFSVRHNSKSGRMHKKKVAATSEGERIEISTETNLYNEPVFTRFNSTGSVVAVYHDGSVPIEVVTRPFHIVELDKKTRFVHEYMRSIDIDLWANGKAGCHMTLLLSSHKYDSEIDPIVAKNFIQLTRLFYSDIVKGTAMGNNGKTRKMDYRRVNHKRDIETLSTDKYSFVNTRREPNSEKVWALEVRAPDGSNDFDKLMETARFYCVLLRFAAHISQYGLIKIEQTSYNEQKEFCQKHTSRMVAGKKTPTFKMLMRQLRPFYQIMRFNKSKQPEEKYGKLFELMLNGASLRQIQTEMPNDFGSLNQIQRKYVKACGV